MSITYVNKKNLGIGNVPHTLCDLYKVDYMPHIIANADYLFWNFSQCNKSFKLFCNNTERHKHINTDNIHTIKECDIRWSFLSCYFQLWFLFTTAHNTRLNFLWFFLGGFELTDWMRWMNSMDRCEGGKKEIFFLEMEIIFSFSP